MISIQTQGNTCYIAGTLIGDDVIALWPKRHGLIPPEIDNLVLTELSHSDSAGVAFLLALWRQAKQSGRRVTLSSPSSQLRKLINLYGLKSFFDE